MLDAYFGIVKNKKYAHIAFYIKKSGNTKSVFILKYFFIKICKIANSLYFYVE
jgi:hypothetical protein